MTVRVTLQWQKKGKCGFCSLLSAPQLPFVHKIWSLMHTRSEVSKVLPGRISSSYYTLQWPLTPPWAITKSPWIPHSLQKRVRFPLPLRKRCAIPNSYPTTNPDYELTNDPLFSKLSKSSLFMIPSLPLGPGLKMAPHWCLGGSKSIECGPRSQPCLSDLPLLWKKHCLYDHQQKQWGCSGSHHVTHKVWGHSR